MATPKRSGQSSPHSPILVVQTAFIGDALLAIPLLKRIKEVFPEKELWLLCRKGFSSFFEETKLVDRVFEVDKNGHRIHDWEDLKKTNFSSIFCPHQSLRSALLVARLRSPVKIGFFHWWNFFSFNFRIKRPHQLPDALRQLFLMSVLDDKIKTEMAKNFNFDFNKKDSELQFKRNVPSWANMRLNVQESNTPWDYLFSKSVAFLAPGSRWATKKWGIDGFVGLGNNLITQGYQVVILGTKDESAICLELQQKVAGSFDLSGQTDLLQLLKLLHRGKLLVVNDSGLMHMGSVANIPTVAIFGPTTLNLGYRPWQDHAIVVETELGCRPCGRHGHDRCPIGTHECMKNITVDQVIRATSHVLER